MSIICLICKEKLLNSAPGSSLGSLNSLVENTVISTVCGHLYHLECLQCWFRTQKKKLQNQGVQDASDHCPTCQAEVGEEQIRRVYLLEDHRDSLERAKLMEKMENLEIYCHQLEIHVGQLRRENDLLLNKALTPSTNPLGKEEFAAIVKNDKVIWLKKDSPPLSGIVLSIYKKEKALWAKLRLDKKIRANSRSGLLGSFRFDRNKEITVPFEEIVLEKDYQKNNVIDENSVSSASSPSTPTIMMFPQSGPSFRTSTLSLPGEYLSQIQGNFQNMNGARGGNGLYTVGSLDFSNNFGSAQSVQFPFDGKHGQYNEHSLYSQDNGSPRPLQNHGWETINHQIVSDPDQREYVILRQNSDPSPQQSQQSVHTSYDQLVGNNGGERSSLPQSPSPTSQDSKKHVTFADDLLQKSRPIVKGPAPPPPGKGNHFRDHDYKNVSEMPMSIQEKVTSIKSMGSDHNSNFQFLKVSKVDLDQEETEEELMNLNIEQIPSINLIEPSAPSTPASLQPDLQLDHEVQTITDVVIQSPKFIPEQGFNQSCFDVTFTTLFLECNVFDRALLTRNTPNDHIQMLVQKILIDLFVTPMRQERKYQAEYSGKLHEAISHLCSSCLDLEELMTILFEYVFKLPPFIIYSFEMCDYIHQFFIDFTDKEKKPTVQQLLERSLALQDNLKLRGEPSPGLFLQMPNSEEGIIHYDAVIPSLTLSLEQLLDKDAMKSESQSCYCNKTATLECATCVKIGKPPILFCEDCSVLLEAIHDQMYHKLDLVPIKALNIPATDFDLAAVICLKGNSYSAFLRNLNGECGPDETSQTKWVFIQEFNDGIPKVENLPKFEEWIESINSNPSNLELNYVNSYQSKLVTEARMYLYLPQTSSSA